MMKLNLLLCLAALGLGGCVAAPKQTPVAVAAPADRESIEWCDIWISHANETNLPRVLLIGDSITRDYYPDVEKHLEGRAYVGRLSTSRFISDPVLLRELALVLDEFDFSVVHFNNGMHGWQHSEAEYRAAFPAFFATIRAHAPHAKLVWATTTPLKVSPAQPRPDEATDTRVAARNAIAAELLQPQGVAVDDLNTLVAGHPEYHSDNVHFNRQGIELEAQQVAASIAPLLPR
ncbi:MAG TPA: SGNH/GDSL hydrolase family protein [Dongiaceae bacterium]|nr:SGNH/GDSL hydrolase family protein [Dongiaceae bacterium]